MANFGYFIKQQLYLLWNLIVNIFYFVSFWFRVMRGKYNRDYESTIDKKDYTLTFEDEFNESEIDWTKWNKWWSENGDPEKTGAEPSIDCLLLDGENLTIRTIKNDNPESPYPYKSGILFGAYDSWWENGVRKEKGWQQMFGYFEIRCKPPKQGKAFWPAFWLWNNTWPPEIDIFEFMSTKDIGKDYTKGISFTSHWGYSGKENPSGYFGTQLGKSFRKFLWLSVDWDKHFHVFACKWTPHAIKWYIDDKCVYQHIYNIPTTQMSIVVNNGALKGHEIEDKDLPGDFIVNYVRAYQKS